MGQLYRIQEIIKGLEKSNIFQSNLVYLIRNY